MPTLQLTDNTTLDITASSADSNATLNRYLMHPLSFLTPAGFDAVVGEQVKGLDATAFPITLKATGEGKFALEKTTLDVQLGAQASIGLLTGSDASDFFTSLQWPPDPAVAGLVSFALQGTLSVGDTATESDLTLGISKATTVTLTSFSTVAAADTLEACVTRAMAALTIPHDLKDLASLPPNTVCQFDASSCLKFTASITYDVVNDPLATMAIEALPPIAVNATAGATIEGTATHTSDHTVTIAKLPNGLIHLSLSLTRTDDFETSLTVSAGVSANVGSQDALAFLLDRISPNSTEEMKKIQADLLPGQVQQLSGDIKKAIDAALCSSLQASLKAALEDSESKNRVFVYEINLAALDQDSTRALQSALTGDFTAITKPNAMLAGIKELDSALTITSTIKHSLGVHLLGIFNYQSINQFVKKSKIDYTKDTHEIVLSDETIEIITNNLDSDKLREVVVKGITLTLPASANTPQAATPLNLVFFLRKAATDKSTMCQEVNVLRATGAPGAAAATSLFQQNLKNYGTSSLCLGLNLNSQQCRQLFLNSSGQPHDWLFFLQFACDAEATILTDDNANDDRRKLFTLGGGFWKQLRDAGAPPNQIALLQSQGIRQQADTDVINLIWWSVAMENYAKAIAANKSIEKAGEGLVKKSTGGFNEPWLVLATWSMLQNPALEVVFTSSLLKPAIAAGAGAASRATQAR